MIKKFINATITATTESSLSEKKIFEMFLGDDK